MPRALSNVPALAATQSCCRCGRCFGCGCWRFPVGLAGEPPSEELRFGAAGAHVELGAPLGASPDAFTTWIRVPLSAPPKPMVIALSGSGENAVSWELDAAAQPLVRWGGDQV